MDLNLLNLLSYGVSVTTLEDVFMKVGHMREVIYDQSRENMLDSIDSAQKDDSYYESRPSHTLIETLEGGEEEEKID